MRIGIENAASCGSLLLLYWLRRGYDLREVNPQISKRLRECLTESHTDLSDALGLAWSVSFHPDLPKVRFTQSTAAWKRLSAVRAQLIKAQTRYLNRLHVLLSESYGPLYKSLFARLKGKGALDFFLVFPTLDDTLADLLRIRDLLGEKRAVLLREAGGWRKSFYLEVLRFDVRLTIKLLQSYREAIKELEGKMVRSSQGDPEVEKLKTIPGMGANLALIILGYSGDFSRFPREDTYAAYCSLAPAIWQLGNSRTFTKPRKRFSRPLKQTFLQLAFTQLRVNPESRAYYQRKRKEGKAHWVALMALARQLSKVVFKMMTEGISQINFDRP